MGVAVSPVSNNFLFLKYEENPFYEFFQKGLNVSLSTDDPLMFHLNSDALLEEYALARQHFHMSVTDLCEVARNSVRQSGFSADVKRSWHGPNFDHADSLERNHVYMTNVPNVRYMFRIQRWQEEIEYLENIPDICEPLLTEYEKLRSTKKTFAKFLKKKNTTQVLSNLESQAPHVG